MTDKLALAPRLTDEGVAFTVTAGFSDRPCVISRHALAYLGRLLDSTTEPMQIYRAFESSIERVARRLIIAGESATPLVLGTAYFLDLSRSGA